MEKNLGQRAEIISFYEEGGRAGSGGEWSGRQTSLSVTSVCAAARLGSCGKKKVSLLALR